MSDTDLIRSVRFRREREADLKRLEALVSEAEKRGLQNMRYDDTRDLAALYRQATSSLAIAREISLDKSLVEYLEALTARAYLSVYAPQEHIGGLVSRFFRRSAPAAIRRCWVYIALAFMTIALGFTAGYLLYFENPAWYYVFTPRSFMDGRGPEASTEYLRSIIYDADPSTSGLGAFATFLFSHNTRIAIFAFGLGAILCVPTIILIFYNGISVGALYAVYVERGLGADLGGWLSIHGVTEISAICIAGAGGLRLGAAILFPGDMTRARSLFEGGRNAVKLALVAALMLIVAAVIEGFSRQLVQDITARYVIGWTIGALWLAWFVLGGRKRP